jgi:hypothetical protein
MDPVPLVRTGEVGSLLLNEEQPLRAAEAEYSSFELHVTYSSVIGSYSYIFQNRRHGKAR